jgi:O-antigen/teichoic acid export membrane protein
MEESLKNKTVKGTFWSAADAFLGQGVTFIVGIVLARLLSPAEYGLIGICMIFTTVLFGLVDSGFSSALIRKKNVANEDYNTMFITNMVISIFFYILLYLLTPFIALFFNQPKLVEVLRVMGWILILQALSITQITILTKRIDFKTKTKASLLSAIISGIVGIVMAILGFGVWALVGQQLSRQLIYTICMWILIRWWPVFKFNLDSFRYMWGFGWKMTLSGLLNNIWNQLYQVVVGKFYSPATLGQYTRSRDYANLFSANFTTIIQRVTYPVLSELQDDSERMVVAYRKVIKVSMFVTALAMISLGAIAEPFIYVLIGPKWNEAATFLPLICISMSLYPLHALNLNMLQVQGRSDIFLYLEILKKIISVGPLLLGIFVNIYWMLIGSIVTGIISFFLNSYYTGKRLGYSSWMQLKDVAPSYGIAMLVAISVYFLKYIPLSYWIVLPLQIVIGIVVIVIVCLLLKPSEFIYLKDIVKEKIRKDR